MTNENYFALPSSYRVQKTLAAPLQFKGIGLHTGKSTKVDLIPAPANHGIIFEKKAANKIYKIPAHIDSVVSTRLATTLGVEGDASSNISTVEHLLAALYALGITNLSIVIEGPEVPILDGSSTEFVEGILGSGIELQNYSSPVIRIKKPIKIYEDGAICEILPRNRLRLTTSVDFAHPSIGLQTFALELTPQSFADDVAEARTFGFVEDLEKLKELNLAQGASLENVLAFTKDGVLNGGGVRFSDECVRHKLLDTIGDFALCGSWIEGEIVSFRGGHSIHLALLKNFSNLKSHWEYIPAEPIQAAPVQSFSGPIRLRSQLNN